MAPKRDEEGGEIAVGGESQTQEVEKIRQTGLEEARQEEKMFPGRQRVSRTTSTQQ